MSQNSAVNTAKIPNNSTKKKYKQKITEIFSLKMFRYSIIKILKAPSTWIMIVISFIIGLVLVGAIGINLNPYYTQTYAQVAQEQIIIYLFIWYILYFGMFSMFIGFKSVQLIRDEIDDGTLLIFASIPISRTRMVIEKWISLQIICLLYGVIILIIPPILILMTGEGGAAFGKLVLTKVNFMILTSFIVQLLLTTIGVLISLGLNSKGVVGILATVGICSIVGGIGPMIFNATHIGSNKAKYILSTTNLARDAYKIDRNKIGETYDKLIDPSGWPIWTVSSAATKDLNIVPNSYPPFSLDVQTFASEANKLITAGATDRESLQNWVYASPKDYPIYSKLMKDHELEFDGLTSSVFQNVLNHEGNIQYTFTDNMDKGFNAFRAFYLDIMTQKPEKAILQKKLLTENDIFSFDKIDRTKLSPNNQKIYDVIANLYSAKILRPQIYQLRPYSYFYDMPSFFTSRNIAQSIRSLITPGNLAAYLRFDQDMYDLIQEAYNSSVLYLNAPILSMVTQAANVFNGIASSISFGQQGDQTGVYADQSKAQDFLDDVNAIATKLKVMGYLNIFQQWVTMWTGDVYVPSNDEFIDIGALVLPVNHYTKVKLNTFTYQNSAVPGTPTLTAYVVGIDPSRGVTIVSLGGLYAGYIIISFGLAALTLWWVSRKDFV